MKTFSFTFSNLQFSFKDFIPFIRDENGNVNETIAGIVDELIPQIQGYCDLRGGYEVFEVSFNENKTILILSQTFNTGKIVFQQLKESEQIAVFICTAGQGISNWSKYENQNGDPLKAYLIDLAGSIIVEKTVDCLHELIKKEAFEIGLNITNRYSPGYCNWDVSEQQKLFSLFPAEFCGVSLSESSLMHPIKSVSGFIGIGSQVKWTPYMCKHVPSKELYVWKTGT
ncbi:MAG: methionine synthase [Bacteroidales bacterium]|nr:methionine synthase [Bacteroidales bacterium]